MILIGGIIGIVILKYIKLMHLLNHPYFSWLIYIVIILWLFIVLHSLFVTIRNVGVLHNFIRFLGKL